MLRIREIVGSKTIYDFICDNCTILCNIGNIGNCISVVFPYGHKFDSMDSEKHFCSDRCLIKYIEHKAEEAKTEEEGIR